MQDAIDISQSFGYPFFLSEYNAGLNNVENMLDTSYAAAFVARHIGNFQRSKVSSMIGYSYWSFSDIFEEQGLLSLLRTRVFGLNASLCRRSTATRVLERVRHADGERREEACVSPVGARVAKRAAATLDGDDRRRRRSVHGVRDVQLHVLSSHDLPLVLRVDRAAAELHRPDDQQARRLVAADARLLSAGAADENRRRQRESVCGMGRHGLADLSDGAADRQAAGRVADRRIADLGQHYGQHLQSNDSQRQASICIDVASENVNND